MPLGWVRQASMGKINQDCRPDPDTKSRLGFEDDPDSSWHFGIGQDQKVGESQDFSSINPDYLSQNSRKLAKNISSKILKVELTYPIHPEFREDPGSAIPILKNPDGQDKNASRSQSRPDPIFVGILSPSRYLTHTCRQVGPITSWKAAQFIPRGKGLARAVVEKHYGHKLALRLRGSGFTTSYHHFIFMEAFHSKPFRASTHLWKYQDLS